MHHYAIECCIQQKSLRPLIKRVKEIFTSRIKWILHKIRFRTQNYLNNSYQKYDIIVFSIIDYHSRYQRPQQFTDGFAKKGHRVFYINANFTGSNIISEKETDNLILITLPNKKHSAVWSTNFTDDGVDIDGTLSKIVDEFVIRDALIVADYPTWINGISFLKDKYGFKVITDYMDDFGGFENENASIVVNDCIRLLEISDAVIASSDYLAELALKYNDNVEIIRNGTEYNHFHTAFNPDTRLKDKKVIGYYGAIANWFDAEKIVYLAKCFQNEDIVLIGHITSYWDILKSLPNVHLLGEKNYSELPQYLSEFDVCLIPFDTSTNLIKATNPVKFYEYLSAGKKVVATEIPELKPYRNKFVYLANDNEEFAESVRKCLNGNDSLSAAEEAMAFASENDWEHRIRSFYHCAESVFPKISVIILCYNQLDYTKQCVNSIINNTAYPNYEIILVDNASEDGTPEWIHYMEGSNERIIGIINKTNRGFAGGNNDGIRASSGDYIVLLNNDTVVTKGWLTGLSKHFNDGNKVGIVGPVTNSIGNEAKIELIYDDISEMPWEAYKYTTKHMNKTYPHIKVLAMFCVMFSKNLVNEIGLLDENYGVGMFEDDDYSEAAKASGYSLVLAEDVFVHHFGSVSFNNLEKAYHDELFMKNKRYYEGKWGKEWAPHKYR